jgi:hypothetical protein
MFDIVDHTLQGVRMLLKDRIDELSQVFSKHVAAFISWNTFRMALVSALLGTRMFGLRGECSGTP